MNKLVNTYKNDALRDTAQKALKDNVKSQCQSIATGKQGLHIELPASALLQLLQNLEPADGGWGEAASASTGFFTIAAIPVKDVNGVEVLSRVEINLSVKVGNPDHDKANAELYREENRRQNAKKPDVLEVLNLAQL